MQASNLLIPNTIFYSYSSSIRIIFILNSTIVDNK